MCTILLLYMVIKLIYQWLFTRIGVKKKAFWDFFFLPFSLWKWTGWFFGRSCSPVVDRIVFLSYTSFWRCLISTVASQDLKNLWPGGKRTVSAYKTYFMCSSGQWWNSFLFEVSRSLASYFNGAAIVSKNDYFLK